MDMKFGTWNVRSMHRAGLLRTVVEEISKYKLELVGVQEVRGDTGAPNKQASLNFSVERGMRMRN
jgi:exonuclease III